MSKKILVITSSGRRKGNTFAMADSFINAAQAKGHTVTRVDAAFGNFRGCLDCKGCFSRGQACLANDDFNQVAPLIMDADAIVFIVPVYWFSFPAPVKAIIDKLWSFVIGEKDIAGKEAALISCCEEKPLRTFDGVVYPYEKSVAYLQWKNVGEVLVPDCFEEGAIYNTDGIARAAALADKF